MGGGGLAERGKAIEVGANVEVKIYICVVLKASLKMNVVSNNDLDI